jgi:flagellar protein FlgJ
MKSALPALPTAAPAMPEPQGLAALKRAARAGGPPTQETLRAVAQQFEALFTQMMLKSMREASLGDDLFGSEQTNFYRDMHDQQLALTMAKQKGLGLSDMLVRQLGGEPAALANSLALNRSAAAPELRAPAAKSSVSDPQAFVATLMPQAERVARELGIAPEAVLAVAVLETGWGSSPIRRADGSSANNFFGIKADNSWRGERVLSTTREFANGRMFTRREAFRGYESVAEGVQDFAQFLRTHPRYQSALAAGTNPQEFVRRLAAAGYATDPAYGEKLASLLAGKPLQTALKNLGDRPISA